MVRDAVLDRVLSHPEVKEIRTEVERQVRDGELTPAARCPTDTRRRGSPNFNGLATIFGKGASGL